MIHTNVSLPTAGECHICHEKGLLYEATKAGETIKICYSCRERVKKYLNIAKEKL